MAKSDNQTIVVLEEKPDSGQTPLSHVRTIIKASDQIKPPKTTQIVRQALKAWADNIDLIAKARKFEPSSDLSSLIRKSLMVSIKVKEYQNNQHKK